MHANVMGMLEKFGEQYQLYMKGTGRYLPRVFG